MLSKINCFKEKDTCVQKSLHCKWFATLTLFQTEDFKARKVFRHRELHFIMIKSSTLKENIS